MHEDFISKEKNDKKNLSDTLKEYNKKIEKIFGENADEQTTWSCVITEENDIELIRETRGVKTNFVVKKSHLDMPEVAVLEQIVEQIADDFVGAVKFIRGDEEKSSNRPLELLNIILEAGKKGVSIQRFKGLGEMNAEQLWETTLRQDLLTNLSKCGHRK